MALAAAIPWKEILKALPAVVSTADKLLGQARSTRKEPPIDPAADLRTQVQAVAGRVQESQAAQAEQAKVIALLAEQLEAVARRSARGYWMAVAALALSCLAVVLALVPV